MKALPPPANRLEALVDGVMVLLITVISAAAAIGAGVLLVLALGGMQ